MFEDLLQGDTIWRTSATPVPFRMLAIVSHELLGIDLVDRFIGKDGHPKSSDNISDFRRV